MLRENYYRPFTEVDQEFFTKSVPDDHYLRKVKALIDFEAFRERVRDAYSPTMGRPAEDPVLLIKLCFLEIHYGLSDREVIAQAQVNTAFRYFLDLSLPSFPSSGPAWGKKDSRPFSRKLSARPGNMV
jgi:transposase